LWEILIEAWKGRMCFLKVKEIREDFIEQCNSYLLEKIVGKIDRTIKRMIRRD